jgi:phosphohistidine swiveling domain-containing protein
VPDGGMAVIIQEQIQGQFSGVAFSRDPLSGDGEAVAIEGLPGPATNVVSGQVTPERYSVHIPAMEDQTAAPVCTNESGQLPAELVIQVAQVAREIERRCHGVPQDLEWTFDGQTLWVLQTRPITTLVPIWTRRIAAEVIPGVLRPLTWSINNPLTCGVWADLFRRVLGRRAQSFDLTQLATLHYGQAYFNATLLGQLFRAMGLPDESLEFLIRGASMGRPSGRALLKTLPGLVQLLGQELTLPSAFRRSNRDTFTPLLSAIATQPPERLTPESCLERIDQLLQGLKQATFFSILAPLSAVLRQKLWRVEDSELDTAVLPETAALRSLQALAIQQRNSKGPDKFNTLHSSLEAFLNQYGYLSDVATDIAVPTWREDPQPLYTAFQRFVETPASGSTRLSGANFTQSWAAKIVQRRVALKGRVAEVYSRLLAELRYTLLALEQHGITQQLFQQPGDIFFLTLPELRKWVSYGDRSSAQTLAPLAQQVIARRHEFELAYQLKGVPPVVYGTPPPLSVLQDPAPATPGAYHGIGASPGITEGTVCVVRSLRQLPATLSRDTILVVPYTDAGWSPLLAQVGGIIAEVGGRLSHGAIVAREYGIPAVMDIAQATQRFQDGQRVRIDGYRGIVEVL